MFTYLREENERFREELSAFDVDFFDEIEDLKYRYTDGVRAQKEMRLKILSLEKQLTAK